MRLIQFDDHGAVRAALVGDGDTVQVLATAGGTYALACKALEKNMTFSETVQGDLSGETRSYQALAEAQCLLPPLTHPDPAHCLVSGTGLTHLGSADTRAAMHAKLAASGDDALTDSMKMFKMGLEGGRPAAGQAGVQPEWFYKGDGSCVVAPESALPVPGFAQDVGEEPELCGLYVVATDGTPVRLGYALGNELSDHVMERTNYLWLAHSKLRACSFGPELRVGELPATLRGRSRILRDGRELWSRPFATGEANMSHTLANLEHHHFKYARFRRPGDVHVHFFGASTLSFADGIRTQAGDVFEIALESFGRALRNAISEKAGDPLVAVRVLS